MQKQSIAENIHEFESKELLEKIFPNIISDFNVNELYIYKEKKLSKEIKKIQKKLKLQ